ncbi:MAG: DUF4416 family protein [candidate division Zixibacteria bacterium]|jgi:hypothetical protein|nr:DUF4416 family protein [candidate division Zixibacteria bacterium]
MGRFVTPPPGRLIISVAYCHIDALADCLTRLEKEFGDVQFETVDIPFTGEPRHTEEMGDPLSRRFFSFHRMVDREKLVDLKRACYKIEAAFADHVGEHLFRAVNVDPGIMSSEKVVMASSHEYNYRLYLGRGVFAQIELIYARGRYVGLPWTNPDFCHPESLEFFARVRNAFDMVRDTAAEAINR